MGPFGTPETNGFNNQIVPNIILMAIALAFSFLVKKKSLYLVINYLVLISG